jgi:hypothetical protein
MQTNLKGLVRTLDLRGGQGMMPLFEAVSNSMDATKDKFENLSSGKIDIYLIRNSDLAAQGSDELQPITGVRVEDDGIGFNDFHFESFREAYTEHKLKSGGKGVGRFTYLKVFDSVGVQSTFENANVGKQKRSFRFSINDEVSEVATHEAEPSASTGTIITLESLRDAYVIAWPREAEAVAQRVVTHFLIRFASAICPQITVHDQGLAPINLQEVFQRTIQPHIQEIAFSVRSHQFNLQVLRHRANRDAHDLCYCAVGRLVLATALRKLLPELPSALVDSESEFFTLQVLVTGDYFDEHANNERTEFVFNPEDEDLASEARLVTRKELDETVASTLRILLAEDLQATNVERMDKITSFIEEDAPEYRILLNDEYKPWLEREVPSGASGTKLDEALLRIRRKVEDQVRRTGQEIAVLVDKQSFDQYEVRMNEFIAKINDVGKSQLASYVAHRRTILDLLDLSLKKSRTDIKYPLEEVLHNMIFPMRETSKDVFLDQQNLWVIDERLCYHTVLTSDKKLNSVPGLGGTSAKEPDIFAFFYDTPIGVQEAEDSTGAVVIIEFKRPGRDDYRTDPAQQIIKRFVEIRRGSVTNIDGRPVNPNGLRYFGYLIADLTESLRLQMEMNYHASVDGEGFFKTLPSGEGYVEVISYDKLMKDAKRRNRVLFDKLGLHKH